MKPSEALKIGRAKRPQIVGDFLTPAKVSSKTGRVCKYGTCDLGAIYEGITGRRPTSIYSPYNYRNGKSPSGQVVDLLDEYLDVDVSWDRLFPEQREQLTKLGEFGVCITAYRGVLILNDYAQAPTERTIEFLESLGL